MKVFVLGCGGVGIAVATLFAKEGEVEKLIVGDINFGNAGKLGEDLKSLGFNKEIEAIGIDGSRKKDVVRAARGTDLVYNATFPQFNIPILEACIEVGASYLDALAFPPLPALLRSECRPVQLSPRSDQPHRWCVVHRLGRPPHLQ